MVQDITQDERLLAIKSPLGKDELLLSSFQGSEHISDLFEFHLEVLSSDLEITPEKLIGKTVTITVQNEYKRSFNGYVNQFMFGEIQADNLRQYKLTVVPWLWFLTRASNNRVFQEMDIKAILQQVFQAHGFNDFEFNLSGNHPSRDYCIQFGETDYHFVSRLLEEEGIAYYFAQENESHKLILTDQTTTYKNCKEAKVGYSKGNKPGSQINQWQHQYEFITGVWSYTDYDFQAPTKDLFTSKKTKVKIPKVESFENYHYPGYYTEKKQGEDLIMYRMEAEEAGFDVVMASSDCSTFYAGGKFEMSEHDTANEKKSYIITSINHRAVDSSYVTGSDGSSEYGNQLICIPDSVQFRPLQKHVRPVMYGPQSAIVVGPSGEEIYKDEFDRIKVQFYWDQDGKKDEHSSCFVRVVQSWAGNSWGTSFVPRIGQEVIISFIDGNPDKPLVTGSVYNNDNKPPYTSGTQSGIKTRSTKGGSNANANELRFEDKKGQEQVYLHAEKNLDTMVENDETLNVGHNRTKTIGESESSSIGKNRDKSVGESQTESIGKNKTIDVGESHTESIGKDKSLDVGANHTENIGKDMKISVGDDMVEDIGKNLGINAGDQITLKTGSASIVMKKNGDITIKGKNITLQGSGKINVKASSAVAIKGSKVTTN